ncbi:DUF1816 domain-containing protein [Gloeobacter violaceus]|uniref:Glr3565 protein n=1 Tax=Gloeobacter violaceus (strain ATCC 29082 / PCC 7421) TaxID=251221 RepID=Q7NFG0_GLOVI|nr:glr3565 [Gloeobacter violaceus PCC 7421]
MYGQTSNTSDARDGDWWLEVTTDEPFLYAFGPFDSPEEAAQSVGRYVPDLTSEGWQVVRQKVLRQEHLSDQLPPRFKGVLLQAALFRGWKCRGARRRQATRGLK